MSAFRIPEVTIAMEGGIIYITDAKNTFFQLKKARVINVFGDSMVVLIGDGEAEELYYTSGKRTNSFQSDLLMYDSVKSFQADRALNSIQKAILDTEHNLDAEKILLAAAVLNVDSNVTDMIHPDLISDLQKKELAYKMKKVGEGISFSEAPIENDCFNNLWQLESKVTFKVFESIGFDDILTSGEPIPTV